MSKLERRVRYRKVQETAEHLRPLLTICDILDLMHKELRPDAVIGYANALALLLPLTGDVLREWLERLDDLEDDMTYRDRALRAERWLRALKKQKQPPT